MWTRLDEQESLTNYLEWEYYLIYIIGSFFFVCLAGMMSGLSVGLLSLDERELEIKLAIGNQQEKKMSKAVLRIISNHHILLTTLLLANAIAMEALPIFLH
jgi:hypothetical protein